jgi:hypothetical protein
VGEDDAFRIPFDHCFDHPAKLSLSLAERQPHIARHAAIGIKTPAKPSEQPHTERKFGRLEIPNKVGQQ